jgi:hypothetical protein
MSKEAVNHPQHYGGENKLLINPKPPNPMNPNEIEVIDYEVVVPLKK